MNTEDELKELIQELRKKHHQARHFCYAFRINPEVPYYRANDDGEPNHSAGTPIYGQIQSFDLFNVGIVVIRYFGGTKLGVPGLINAYKESARLALEASDIIVKHIEDEIHFSFEYPDMNEVMKIIKDSDSKIAFQEMNLHCIFKIQVQRSLTKGVKDALGDVKSLIFV